MIDLPRNPNPNPGKDESTVNLFGYIPSRYLSIPSIILFFLYALINFIYIFKRKWKGGRLFSFLLIVGSFLELLGYLSRFFAYDKPFYTNWFVFSYCFIVCAPIFFSAAIYLALYHLILSNQSFRSFSIIGPKLLVGLFTMFDVVTIIAQVGGAALTGMSTSQVSKGEKPWIKPKVANNILTIGLGIQNASFAFFLIVFIIFCIRSSKASKALKGGTRPDVTLLNVIGITGVLVFLRTIFRLVEAADGFFSEISVNEHIFGWLETFPILLAIAIWTLIPLGFRLHKQREREEDLLASNFNESGAEAFEIQQVGNEHHERSNSSISNNSSNYSYKYGLPKREEMRNNNGDGNSNGNGFAVYGYSGNYVGHV